MSKINVLDKHTAELIAAGEVVERPASVVKELVENSIDSGATTVTVEIQMGGIAYIRVADNGCGIEREDVPKAFLRHATSKVRTENDLEQIGTLGFRGEALPSIAAVAKVDVLTKSVNEEVGTHYVAEGSEQVSLADAGCPAGTTIIVRDLFYNTPARMKFLKKNVSEANAVADILDRLALSHPEVSVRFIRDGKETLLTPGDGRLISSIHAVYGREFASSLIPVEYAAFGLSINGYSSKPVYGRVTRAMQNFFVNGRFVKSGTAAAALSEAYKNAIMAGKFPACVLQITIPLGAVDANVHPAKTEIRFSNEKTVFDLIYYAAKTALEKGDTRVDIALKTASSLPVRNPFTKEAVNPYARQAEKPVQTTLHTNVPAGENHSLSESAHMYHNGLCPPETPLAGNSSLNQKGKEETVKIYKAEMPFAAGKSVTVPRIPDAGICADKAGREVLPDVNTEIAEEKDAASDTGTLSGEETVAIIGEVFGTYIIAQVKERILIIDKHAAHERILFDRIRTQHWLSDAQLLLSPIRVTLAKNQYDAMLAAKDTLQAAGIIIDDFGAGDLIVRGVPLLTESADIGLLAEEIAERLLQHKNITTEHIDWIFHSVACRAAVKAGDRSDVKEIEALAKRIVVDDTIRYCPHGRPVAVWLTKRELEKQFGRI